MIVARVNLYICAMFVIKYSVIYPVECKVRLMVFIGNFHWQSEVCSRAQKIAIGSPIT